MTTRLITLLLCVVTYSLVKSDGCSPRKYDQDSVVCVCNVTYCDTFDSIRPSPSAVIQAFVSTRDGRRFDRIEIRTTNLTLAKYDVEITTNSSEMYQAILGFGSAFTDAAGLNVLTLKDQLQYKVTDQYWSRNGLRFNLGRVVMGGSDFSTSNYTYNDVAQEDFDLKNFALTTEDNEYKIPFIKRAVEFSDDEVLLFASAWSAPAWMKSNGKLNGRGWLKGDTKGKYYRTWANYYVKFLNKYKEKGINFWGLTTGNEPMNGFIPRFPFNCLAFSASSQRDFVKYHLGPALNASGYGKLALMMLDDQRYQLPWWPRTVLSDPEANKYISGIALHWYGDKFLPASIVSRTHEQHPDKFILNTEATHIGKPKLGNWSRGAAYLRSILTDLNNWMVGWVEWNFALDLKGGPNWVNNFCDAPIIVNATSSEFYKQPMYYALAHVSRFVPRESVRTGVSVKDHSWKLPFTKNIVAGSFVNPSGDKVVIVLNEHSTDKSTLVTEVDTGVQYQFILPAKSFVTFYRDAKKSKNTSR